MAFELRKTYKFDTLAPSVLGVSVINAKLVSMLDYDSAMKHDNVLLKHRSILPLLPPGTPDLPETDNYYLFRTQSGTSLVLGERWIDMVSLVLVQNINFRATFTNSSVTDMNALRDMLNSMGFTNYQLEEI